MGMLHQEPYQVMAHVAVELCHQLALGIALLLRFMGPRCMTPAVLVGAVQNSEDQPLQSAVSAAPLSGCSLAGRGSFAEVTPAPTLWAAAAGLQRAAAPPPAARPPLASEPRKQTKDRSRDPLGPKPNKVYFIARFSRATAWIA